MSNALVPLGTAVVGYFIGGPTGAQIGWMIGSAYQSSQQEIVQPSVGDLRIQTSQYGVPIPIIVGRQRVAGNIIWASEKSTYEIKQKTGKGGGPTTVSTGYRISMLISLCKGPILGVSRVWADGKLIVDARTSGSNLPGELYLGNMSQNPDPTYQSHVGADAPAYRGLAYMSLTDYDLGVSGRVPQFSFEVVKGGVI